MVKVNYPPMASGQVKVKVRCNGRDSDSKANKAKLDEMRGLFNQSSCNIIVFQVEVDANGHLGEFLGKGSGHRMALLTKPNPKELDYRTNNFDPDREWDEVGIKQNSRPYSSTLTMTAKYYAQYPRYRLLSIGPKGKVRK